ncbi:MAG: GyrI-like domain-containing protein [Methanomicrobiales archaeon]|nr:GyrI-like domain-containing protein [Methanomicrobiales archaeon]
MEAQDLKKEFNRLYRATTRRVDEVDVPAMKFLMVDGSCDGSNFDDFRMGIEGLFALSQAMKTAIARIHIGFEYAVMPLECLWWVRGTGEYTPDNREEWRWILMVVQPNYVTSALAREALSNMEREKFLPSISKVRYGVFTEGLSFQTLHNGPRADKWTTINRLRAFIEKKGFEVRGRHHEIYISDPRTLSEEKMKMIIRLPVIRRE